MADEAEAPIRRFFVILLRLKRERKAPVDGVDRDVVLDVGGDEAIRACLNRRVDIFNVAAACAVYHGYPAYTYVLVADYSHKVVAKRFAAQLPQLVRGCFLREFAHAPEPGALLSERAHNFDVAQFQ